MGRTREFETAAAVDQALHVFWQKGYEGTSLSDLTDALGINRPSLYAAFGSKEGLFRKAVERYASGYSQEVVAALDASPVGEVVGRILRFYADVAGREDRPKGCLLVQGALVCSDEGAPARELLADHRRFLEEALAKRLERAKREGELPKDARPADLARYVWAVCSGMAVQAVDGATRDQLRRVAALALEAWPK